MDTVVKVIADTASTLTPAAITLGVIGVIVGLTMSVVGYRHGADLMRTSLVDMAIVLATNVIGTWLKTKLDVA